MALELRLTLLFVCIGFLTYNEFTSQGISLGKNGNSRTPTLTYLSSVRFSTGRCKNNYHKSVNKSNTYLFLLLLTISHDTETNPGPNDSTRYPCGTCNNSVTWEQKAMCCDTCETWYHIDCQGMASYMYSIMDKSENIHLSWDCIHCGLPNFSTSIFDYTCIETSNRFSTFNSSANSDFNMSNIGEPNATSSPLRTTHDKGKQRNKQSTKSTPLRVININFQSINNKKPELDQLIQSVKPDIILGTETWLSNETSSYEYFPSTEYTVYRKDRCCNSKDQSHGGVLIAVSKDILSQEVPELQTDCENVWVEVNLVNARKLIIGCFYRPPSDNGHALDQLRESLNRINTNAHATVLLGGDFNLGHIDWSIPAVIPGKPDHAQHISIINMINDFSLEQIVNKPTRGERILDLILTCILSKLCEHIISSNIMKHLESNSILYDLQHGFRSSRSCDTQLISFLQELSQSSDQNLQTDVIVMDFAKAFDKVPHKRLLYKLAFYGIRENTLHWIQDFLHLRTQAVVLEGTHSDQIDVTSGVPQGTVLGPILFLLYINDFHEYLSFSTLRLFADDSIIYKQIKTPDDTTKLQHDLDAAARWEQDWLMSFHPDKCSVLHVTNKRNPITHNYTLHDHTLTVETSTKYLGITIQNNLKWNKHIDNITANASKQLNFLKRNLKVPSTKIKERAYQSLVRPKLEYNCCTWDPHTKSHIHQIEMIQRRAARYTTNKFHNTSSVNDMLTTLNWPTLQQRRLRTRLIFFYKVIHNIVAIYPAHLLIPQDTRTRHSNPSGFKHIHTHKDIYKYSFFPHTITQWNKLPPDITLAPSLEAFKEQASMPVICRYKTKWNIDLKLKPFFLGGIMQGADNRPPGVVPSKAIYLIKDVERCSDYFGVPLKPPSEPFKMMFEIGSLSAQRFITAVDMKDPKYTEALSRQLSMRIWNKDKHISRPEDFMEAGKLAGMNDELIKESIGRIKDQDVKDRLKAYTQEALNHGAFGAPTFIAHVDGKQEMVFGSDRFPILAKILGEEWLGPLKEEARAKL
ncbi:hypothetical protein FSP39_002497 [Pinctada imbricata]|uniref:Glutathione S-transferase kappa 1 n=1 Tax=Pinctada imbricata TaxID=66713 RepID=A0AA88YS50_PINIB|nr:hypothetical protein FSP39_002497 [Pinctada imbricata]